MIAARIKLGNEDIGDACGYQRAAAEIHASLKASYNHDIARVIDRYRTSILRGRITKAFAPEVIAIRIEFGEKNIQESSRRERATAKVRRAVQKARDHDIARAVDLRRKRILRTRIAKLFAPQMIASRIEFGDENIAGSRRGEWYPAEIHRAQIVSGDHDIVRVIDCRAFRTLT